MDIGSASRAMPGQSVCGDRYLVTHQKDQTLIAVADGLGHGPQAAMAAEAACEAVRENAALPLTDLMRACDKRLRATRGAALALMRIEPGEQRLTHVAVGNVEVVCRSVHPIRPISIPGIVGGYLRKLFEQRFMLSAGDCLVCFTDGIAVGFELDRYRTRDAQAMATAILNDRAKLNDDATCVVLMV